MKSPRGADRAELLAAVRWFLERIPEVPGVERVELVGSLATDKPDPKDLDLLVTVGAGADLTELAALGRKVLGRRKTGTWGADLFVVEDGRCLGRTCNYREPHPRVRCGRCRCVPERPFLCDTSGAFTVDVGALTGSGVLLWPQFQAAKDVPGDVVAALKFSPPVPKGIRCD